ncbi:MAG: hypothetical protein AB8C46_14240 [Burkholderiaceae bacterium]
MLESWIVWLEATAVSKGLRTSIWLYPIVNTLHILGLGLLLGATVVLDLRLLGWRRSVSVASLAPVLLPVAGGGLAVATAAGILLFIARPLDYVFNGLFQIKLALLALALLNIWWCMSSSAWQQMVSNGQVNTAVKTSAALSLFLWLAIIFAGRMIGYR